MAHKLFIDINVVLDVAGEREPHWESSQKVLSLIEKKKAAGFISAASYPTLFYLLSREIGPVDTRDFLGVLMELLSIVAVNRALLEKAMSVETDDFEDAIQMAGAKACRADFIVTRDLRGYRRSPVKVLTPSEYLATFAA